MPSCSSRGLKLYTREGKGTGSSLALMTSDIEGPKYESNRTIALKIWNTYKTVSDEAIDWVY